ncbi:hypothetical protein [Enterococcus sp. UD-01]|jgi:hypothetical protein|uniref:hypothetical protein n=1 Tax=Enterococcus sp. UD-01 TaxID=3373911 RepID=UPI003836D346
MKSINLKKCAKYGLLVLAIGVLGVNFSNLTGAKYKTESQAVTDTARVAKWISGTTVSLDLFKDSYAATDTALSGKDAVKSADSTKVIAPGTTGTYDFSPALSGDAPEVAYKFKFTAAGAYTGNWNVNSTAYEPLKFTLSTVNGSTVTKLVEDVTLSALVTKINEVGADTVIEAGSLPSTTTKYRITWNWPFSVNDATDIKDTALADKLISEDLTVDLSVTIGVEQVD